MQSDKMLTNLSIHHLSGLSYWEPGTILLSIIEANGYLKAHLDK